LEQAEEFGEGARHEALVLLLAEHGVRLAATCGAAANRRRIGTANHHGLYQWLEQEKEMQTKRGKENHTVK
jgi:hypothetical protein